MLKDHLTGMDSGSDQTLMRLALRAAIQLERAKAAETNDLEPVRQLGEALEHAASLGSSGAQLSLAQSGSLQPFQQLYALETVAGKAGSLSGFLSDKAKEFLAGDQLEESPARIEELVEFCNKLHRILRSNLRAERDAHARDRRTYGFRGATGGGVLEDTQRN